MFHRPLTAAILLLAFAGCADAAEQPRAGGNAPATAPRAPPPPPLPGSARPGVVIDPLLACGGYFRDAYGVSLEEGCRRMRNQEHVSALSQAINANPPAGFSSIWIQHAPEYAIVVAFKAGASEAARTAVTRHAHPSIRNDLVFRAVRRTAAEIAAAQDRIDAALRRLGGPWSGGFDVNRDRFAYTFGSQSQLTEARRLIPAELRDDVDLQVGAVPVPFG